MNTIKGWISTTVLLSVLSLTTTSVNAGIIVGNLGSSDQKALCKDLTSKLDWGIIVGNVTGIIVGNLTGIIVGNFAELPKDNCGIIVGN